LLRVLRDEGLIDIARTDAQEIVAQDSLLAKWPQLAQELKLLQADEVAEYIDKG
jgi:hypothetical protein